MLDGLGDQHTLDLKCAQAIRAQLVQDLCEWFDSDFMRHPNFWQGNKTFGQSPIVVAKGMCSCFVDASDRDNDVYSYEVVFRHYRAAQ